MEKASDATIGERQQRSPDVLGDDLLGAVREVKVDEVGELSHGDERRWPSSSSGKAEYEQRR
jgi:hypothetical protein